METSEHSGPGGAAVYAYRIDARDEIVFVSDAWLEFYRANAEAPLERAAVLQQPLWNFIDGRETQHIYELIFRAVREGGSPAVISFRCDSPDRRRYMSLRITAAGAGALDLEGVLLREESREAIPLLEASFPRSDEFLVICSWCKRIRTSGGDWAEVEQAVRDLGLFASPRLPCLSHGICAQCDEDLDRAGD